MSVGRLYLTEYYVYALFCEQEDQAWIKIGLSTNPLKRLQAHCSNIPMEGVRFAYANVGSKYVAKSLEERLIVKSSAWAARGEWITLKRSEYPDFHRAMCQALAEFDTRNFKRQWNQIDVREYRKQQAGKSRMKRRAVMAGYTRMGRAGRDFLKDSKGQFH